MPKLRLLLLLALAACAPKPVETWRDASVPIHSMVTADLPQMQGAWREEAGYRLRPGCTPGALTISGTTIVGQGCFLPVAGSAAMVPTGPGRFAVGGRDWWLLWVDADVRTALIGTPDGRFAAVLNRGGPISPDRMVAAKKILAFNGYDISRLELR